MGGSVTFKREDNFLNMVHLSSENSQFVRILKRSSSRSRNLSSLLCVRKSTTASSLQSYSALHVMTSMTSMTSRLTGNSVEDEVREVTSISFSTSSARE
ncbi:hypothetical protein Mapa_013503 [Marchantia paleacea]|nr:hypothetical protein Mapa_013503 [Marchantia paleacea]